MDKPKKTLVGRVMDSLKELSEMGVPEADKVIEAVSEPVLPKKPENDKGKDQDSKL